MSSSGWRRSNGNVPELCARALGVGWALVMTALFVVALRDHHPVFTSRLECGTDPRDILRPGEVLEQSTLRFIVDAHCSNARYLPDDWIALRYVGGAIDVETRPLVIGGQTYYEIVSVGGESAP